MGIWDFINSTTDAVKRNSPNLSSVRNACRSSYDYGQSTFTKIDNAVRVDAVQRLKQYLSNDQGRAKIGRLAKNAAVSTCLEGLKCVPGGVSVYNIVTQSLCDEKSKDYLESMKTLQARIDRLERESSHYRKLLDEAEMLRCDVELESRITPCLGSNTDQKPEDAIRIFMMTEFVGRHTHILDDLVVPGVRHGKNQK